jgi:hypothetical protein
MNIFYKIVMIDYCRNGLTTMSVTINREAYETSREAAMKAEAGIKDQLNLLSNQEQKSVQDYKSWTEKSLIQYYVDKELNNKVEIRENTKRHLKELIPKLEKQLKEARDQLLESELIDEKVEIEQHGSICFADQARILNDMQYLLPTTNRYSKGIITKPTNGGGLFNHPDNIRYVFAECGKEDEVPTWFLEKYNSFLKKGGHAPLTPFDDLSE